MNQKIGVQCLHRWNNFKSLPRKAGRKYWIFESKMMNKVMPYREKMFSRIYSDSKQDTLAFSEAEKAQKISSGMKKARAYAIADLSLESLNFASIGFSALNFFGAFGSSMDSFVRETVSLFGISMHDNAPKWALVLASAAVSKLIVKVGCWVETFQMVQLESLARKTGFIRERGASKLVKRYSQDSLVEQIKDAVVVLVPVPFFELLRRRRAILAELRQLDAIKKLESIACGKKDLK